VSGIEVSPDALGAGSSPMAGEARGLGRNADGDDGEGIGWPADEVVSGCG
jgi:hypothetical protein